MIVSEPDTSRHGACAERAIRHAPAAAASRAALIGLIAAGGSIAAADARAAEHCVICNGPQASYVCVPDGLPPAAAQGLQGQMVCIEHFARSGPHAECSISRVAAAPCTGPQTVVGVLGGAEAAQARVPFDGAGAAATRGDGSAGTDRRAPQAVRGIGAGDGAVRPGGAPAPAVGGREASASVPAPVPADAAPDTRNGLEKAGDAVGTAARKTWDCLSSFLKDC